MLGSFWTIANILSLSRIPLCVVASLIILRDGPISWSLMLIIAAGLTDLFDGQIARRTNTVSEWGKILDPVADKISVALVGIALAWKEILPLWFLLAILLRDFLIVIGGLILTRQLGLIHMSNFWGKVTATAIGVTFIFALLKADQVLMTLSIWGTIGLLGLSLLIYAARLTGLRNKTS